MYSAEERAFAQSCYLEQITEKAKEQFNELKMHPPVRTDIQGRLIFDIQLDQAAINGILTKISNVKTCSNLMEGLKVFRGIDHGNVEQKKFFLESLLGHPLTATTTVSYDTSEPQLGGNPYIQSNPYLSNQYLQVDRDNIIKQYNTLIKDRIINLRHETYFHAQLIGSMLKTALKNTVYDHSEFQKGLEAAMTELEDKIYKLEAKALETAYKKNQKTGYDQEKFKEQFRRDFNQELDSARKKLLPEIAKAVREHVIRNTGIKFSKEVTAQLTIELAKNTTATSNDVVHISKAMGAISYMGGSAKTSHHQELGAAYVADKLIYTHHLQADEKVEPLAHRQHVRVPALAIKSLPKETKELLAKPNNGEGIDLTLIDNTVKREFQIMRDKITKPLDQKKVFDAIVIEDTAAKLNHLQEKYQLGRQTKDASDSRAQGIPSAFVYNLYTSINDKSKTLDRYDEWNNKQTQSASHILQAAHQYNKKALENQLTETIDEVEKQSKLPIRKPLCLVQNIPVNGWGHSIKRHPNNPTVVNEAAVMSELATLHTVFDVLSDEDKEDAKIIFNEYDAFLRNEDFSFFYKYLTDEKNLAESLSLLDKIKKSEQQPKRELSPPPYEFLHQAKCALAQFFKKDAYSDLANGYTYQALSVFAEPSSIGGCKSANERTQAVNGRVAILDFISLGETRRDQLRNEYGLPAELMSAAKKLEEAINEKNLSDVVTYLDDLYGKLNLEGFQALISMIDQGGHAKLATHGSTYLPNTNASERVHTNTANASKWQCHKGLIDNVQEAFTGVNPSKVKKEMQNILIRARVGAGVVGGAVLGLGLGLNVGPLIATALGISAAFPPVGLVIAMAAAIPFFAYAVLKIWEYLQPIGPDCFAEKLKENEDWAENLHLSAIDTSRNFPASNASGG